MSTAHSVSRDSDSEAAAPAPSTAQHNDSTEDPTRLINALKGRNHELSRSLLESLSGKALTDSVNARDGVLTTLHYALTRGFYDLVPELTKHATDKNEFVTTPDDSSMTALHLAALHSGVSDAATVVEAIRELVKYATDKKEYITTQDHRSRTALHYAASRKHVEPVKILLTLSDISRKNYVNKKDRYDQTPLHQAAMSNSVDIAALLLESGADAEIEDKDRNTAWDIACNFWTGEERWRFLATLIVFASQGEMFISPFSTPTTMGKIYIRLCKPARRLNALKNGDSSESSRPLSTDTGVIEVMTGLLSNVRKEFRENQEAQRPYLRSREPSCTVLNPKLKGGDQSFEFLSLVIPYIYIDKRRVLDRRVEVVLADRAGSSRKFLEWHMPTTLDEYCNPSLSKGVLDLRNDDQVLGRYEKKKNVVAPVSLRDSNGHHRKLLTELWILVRAHIRKFLHFFGLKIPREPKRQEETQKNAEGTKAMAKGENTTTAGENVVFVHQAWVWIIDKEVIMTELLPYTWDNNAIRWGILPWDQAQGIGHFLNEAVRRLERPAVGPEGSLLRTYENALVVISEEVGKYTKSARFEDIDLDKEKDLFHQISDLREETSMIKSVLAEQEEVWTEFMRLMGPNKEQGHHSSGASIANQDPRSREPWRLQTQIDKYKRRIRKLEEDAERVQQNISTMLDLKQKHAAMREAHSTAVLGATVFGFTVITVIYAPLAFVAALFALPIDKFNEGKDMNGTDGVYSSSYIGKWSVATEFVSIAITLIAMWAGLRFAGLHVWGQRGLREYIKQKADAVRTEEEGKLWPGGGLV